MVNQERKECTLAFLGVNPTSSWTGGQTASPCELVNLWGSLKLQKIVSVCVVVIVYPHPPLPNVPPPHPWAKVILDLK
jgi:hypothetical protein